MQCRPAKLEQRFVVERVFEMVMLRRLAVTTDTRRNIRLKKYRRQIEMTRFPVIDLSHLQALRMAHHLVHTAEAELSHQLTHFLRNEHHKVDEVRRISSELRSQFRILCGHADRAGVQMTSTHHDATERDERRSSKTKLFRAKQRGHNNVTTCF